MKRSSYEDIVRNAVSHMERNVSKSLSMREIASAVYYSPDHLRYAFRKVTGRGVLPYFLELKLERAKQLLRETDLSIAEIAANTGFEDSSYFCAFFRNRAGMAPGEFRVASRQKGEATSVFRETHAETIELFRDPFSEQLSDSWKVLDGEWKSGSGFIEGSADGNLTLGCLCRLPENFRVTFDSFFVITPNFSQSDLYVMLTDAAFSEINTSVVIGTHGNTIGLLERKGSAALHSTTAILRQGQWQRACVELRDDTLTVHLDEQEIFHYRDPFPGPYTSRSRIVIGSWTSLIRFRNFAIADLGIQSLVRTVRQGDALFNAGLYTGACEFYQRQLESGRSSINGMELRYKIGMSYLRQSSFASAEQWLAKVVTRPEIDFWAVGARIAEVEALWAAGKMGDFCLKVESLSPHTLFRDGLRELLTRAGLDLELRGFHQQACRVFSLHAGLEEKNSLLSTLPGLRLAENLFCLNRFEQAESIANELLPHALHSPLAAVYIRFLLADTYAYAGKLSESNETYKEIETLTKNQSERARSFVFRCRNLRGAGCAEDAAVQMEEIPRMFPRGQGTFAFAFLCAALTYCSLGRPENARRAIEKARELNPDAAHLWPVSLARFLYAPELLEQKHYVGAEILRNAAEKEQSITAARYLIHAGILFEVSGDHEAALKSWTNAVLWYPSDRFGYYSILARDLIDNKTDAAFAMPYPAQIRSETFYLLGLLCNYRGESQTALRFFRQSLAEDPTRSWPAALAGQELSLIEQKFAAE